MVGLRWHGIGSHGTILLGRRVQLARRQAAGVTFTGDAIQLSSKHHPDAPAAQRSSAGWWADERAAPVTWHPVWA